MATIEHDDVFPLNPSPPVQQEELTEDMALMNLLADIGGTDSDAKVSVYRISGSNRKLSFIRSYLPNEFSLEQLQSDIGAGDYRVQVRANGGLLANKAISIEANPEKITGNNAINASNSTQGSPDINKLAEIMSQGFQQLGTLMLQNRAPVIDPNQMRRDMMQDMVIMKQLFERPEPAQNGAVGAIEMFMKGMEMAKDITPKEGDTGPMDIMLEALKTFGAPIAQAAMARQEMPAPSFVPVTAPTSIPQPLPKPEENKNMNPALNHYVNMLVALAKENRDPYLYADLIVDQVSEEEIRGFLNDPDLMGTLSKINPDAANYGEWIGELKKGILDILTSVQNGSMVNTDANPLIITHAASTDIGRNQQTDADNGAVTVNT